MISRDTRVQGGMVAAAISLLLAFAWLAPASPEPWLVALVLGVHYGLAFGGTHLYLYVRGDGETLPRSARARFLVMIGIILPLLTAATVLPFTTVSGIDVSLALRGVSVLTFVVYFLHEARLGYASRRPSGSG